MELTKVRLQQTDGDYYLIPEELVNEFQQLNEEIYQNEDKRTEDFYSLLDKFDTKFVKYRMEGDLFEIDL